MAGKILLVEDEENLAKAILLNLELENHHTTWIKNGNTALETLLKKPNFFDLVILDVMLPEKDGFEICKSLRKEEINIPVLFLSARNSGNDKVLGLKAGADDYLGKPFNLEELLLRIEILLRRKGTYENLNSTYKLNGWEINFKSHNARNTNNQIIKFSNLEIKLLKYLISKPNESISRDQLMTDVWNDNIIKGRTIDNMILKFRKTFENDPKTPIFFISIRGVGYKFCPAP